MALCEFKIDLKSIRDFKQILCYIVQHPIKILFAGIIISFCLIIFLYAYRKYDNIVENGWDFLEFNMRENIAEYNYYKYAKVKTCFSDSYLEDGQLRFRWECFIFNNETFKHYYFGESEKDPFPIQ